MLKGTVDKAVEQTPDGREGDRVPAPRAGEGADRASRRAATSTGTRLSLTADPGTAAPRRSWRRSTRSSSSTPPVRRASPRASCTPPRGYLAGALPRPQARVRSAARRRLLLHGRRRLGHRAQLHRRTARSRTAPPACSTRALPITPTGAASGHHRQAQVTILYTAPTAIRAFIRPGRRVAGQARSLEPALARHAWVSRSIRKRGCGTTSTSGRSAARSSTPGGRRRRAPSC